MTQASLTPDLDGALGATTPDRDAGSRPGTISEAPLWIIALTSLGLMVATMLLFGMLARNAVADASFIGFVAGVALVISAIGVGGLAYALVTARRAGLLAEPGAALAAASSATPAGMHVVPALPPDLGQLKRRRMEEERKTRSRQAKAIATATAVSTQPRQVAPPHPIPPPVARTRTAPQAPSSRAVRPAPARASRPAPARVPRPAATRSTPARPMPARPTPARPPRMPAARVVPIAPTRPQAPARPVIRMPRPQLQQPRPAAWPSKAPAVRMPPPWMRPRTQVAAVQVAAANVRAAVPIRPH